MNEGAEVLGLFGQQAVAPFAKEGVTGDEGGVGVRSFEEEGRS